MPKSIDPDQIPFVPGQDVQTAGLRTGDPRIDAFAAWLAEDVQGEPGYLADICDSLGQHQRGLQTEPAEFSGNAWAATVTPGAVELENHFSNRRESLPLADAALILHRYWDYVRAKMGPGRFDKQVAKFTNRNNHPPYLPWPQDASS